jgi:hypothetical protein
MPSVTLLMLTSNLLAGELVPIPTLPAFVLYIDDPFVDH